MNVYVMGRKALQGIILVVLVAIIIFIVFRLMPGNPADLFLYSLKNKPTAAEKEHILAQLGLANGKWSYQDFVTYMSDTFTLNFGTDYFYGENVWTIISIALPYTLILVGTAAVLGWVIGIPLGITTTRLRNRKPEPVLLTGGLILSSIPYLIIAVMLFLYFIADLGWFPNPAYFEWTQLSSPTPSSVFYVFRVLFLPLASLFVVGAAGHLITMRATMVSILGEDFITTARAKGVPEKQILRRHAARNAMIPVSTRMALEIALIVSGAILVDIVFSYPGIGYWLYEAVLHEDYPLSEAGSFMIAVISVGTYLIIDYIHAWLDPRIRI